MGQAIVDIELAVTNKNASVFIPVENDSQVLYADERSQHSSSKDTSLCMSAKMDSDAPSGKEVAVKVPSKYLIPIIR